MYSYMSVHIYCVIGYLSIMYYLVDATFIYIHDTV
jgi:hypothetical protein